MANERKLLEDFEASLHCLTDNVDLFDRGRVHAYRSVSVELRKLIADADLKECLAYKILGDFELNQSRTARMIERSPGLANGLQVSIYGPITISGTGVKMSPDFAAGGKRIPLSIWRREPFLAADISVYQLVRSVADKEAAHADDEYDAILKRLARIRLGDEVARAHIVVSVGRYLLSELEAGYRAKVRG